VSDKLFFTDINKDYSYPDLYAELNQTKQIYNYCYVTDYFSVFKNIILSLMIDKPITLLDIDLSEKEIQQLTNGDYDKKETYSIPHFDFKDIDKIIDRVHYAEKWRLNLFTSGTTGTPKSVSHTFSSITRNIKISQNHSEDIWGFAYNPTHMAGVQVFFQAFLNKNTIIRLFQIQNDEIVKRIRNFGVTHISATSTFYKLLLPIKPPIANVKQITFGGEKIDKVTKNNLETAFPYARILNIYASTEAGTLLTSKNDVFTVREEIKDFIKIEGNELFIHSKLLGKSDSIQSVGDWYPTGDMVEMISEKPLCFRFMHRKGETINVGGYNINPIEVEEVLMSYEGITDAYVYGKKNRITGNIIMADIICKNHDLVMVDLYKYLRSCLQEFKIPRIINMVDEIQKTNTGKKKRT